MHSAIELHPSVANYLGESELPVRVLNGNANAFNPPASWRGSARANNATLEDCEAKGITIVSWGMDHVPPYPDTYLYAEQFSADFGTTDQGVPIPCQREWVRLGEGANPDGVNLTDGDGRIFARVVGRTIYCAFPLDKFLPWDEMDLHRVFGDAFAEAAEAEGREAQRQRERARELFLAQSRQSLQTRIDALRNQVDSAAETIRSYETEIRTAVERRISGQRELSLLEAGGQELDDKLIEQWEAMLRHPKVVDIGVNNSGDYGHLGGVWVETVGLNITAPNGCSGYLGRMRIIIPAVAYNGITIRNLDNRQQDDGGSWRDHPHVVETGPCFGNIETLVATLRSNGEIAGLIEIIIQYLESYNPADSWGRTGYLWVDGHDGEGGIAEDDYCTVCDNHYDDCTCE